MGRLPQPFGMRFNAWTMRTLEPRVTVAIPTYNRAALLSEAIESVLAQTYEGFVLLVADNASTDGTPEVVASFADERLRHVRRPQNVGLLGNFNACLAGVKTDYCLIVCDDDHLSPDFLAETVSVLDEHPEAGMVHTAFQVIDGEGRVVQPEVDWTFGLEEDTVESGEDFLAESMKWGCRVCSSAALMRTAALPPEPFEEDDFPAIDFGLWLRMAVEWQIAFVARPLAAYRVHEASQTAQLAVPNAAGYRTGVEWVTKREDVKRRFLQAYGDRLAEAATLMQLVPRSRRQELLVLVRQATLPERNPLSTLRMLGWAARADRRVVIDPAAWKLMVASVLPPRFVERAKTLRTP